MKLILWCLILWTQTALASNLLNLEGEHSLDVVADSRVALVLESLYDRSDEWEVSAGAQVLDERFLVLGACVKSLCTFSDQYIVFNINRPEMAVLFEIVHDFRDSENFIIKKTSTPEWEQVYGDSFEDYPAAVKQAVLDFFMLD